MSLKPIRVLIADNDPGVCSALKLVLSQHLPNPQIQLAVDKQALRKCMTEQTFDWIFLDWELPGLKSFLWIQSARQKFAHTKIIAMSTAVEARKSAEAAGATAFLNKTDSPESLLTLLSCETIDHVSDTV